MSNTLTSERDDYLLIEPIGEGGFGTTWLAERGSDGAQVVVKRLKVARAREWKAVELFQREARVLSELDHPNIPDYLDHFTIETDDGPDGFALVQEYVDGKSLRQKWRDGEELELGEMLGWLFTMLEVLDYLHGLSPPVIHRDISPKNIMLRESDGRAFLIDFGTVQAKLASASTISSTSAGTFGYAAMEQFVGRAVPASDLYGLAMTFLAVHLRTEPESLPFANNRVLVREALSSAPLDARLTLALDAMTRPDAARRPQSAADVLRRLRPLRPRSEKVVPGARPPAPPPESSPEATDRWRAARDRNRRLDPDRAWKAQSGWVQREPESIAVSDDGSRLLIVTYDACIALDTATMEAELVVEGAILDRCGAFSADGQKLAIVDGYGQQLHLIDDRHRTMAGVSSTHASGAVAVSPDGGLVAVAPEDVVGDVIRIFDWETGERVQSISPKWVGREPSSAYARSLAFSPDGSALVHTTRLEGVLIFAEGATDHHPEMRALALSPDGRRVATVEEGAVRVVELGSLIPWRPVGEAATIPLAKEATDVRFTPDGSRLVIACRRDDSHAIVVHDLVEGRRVDEIGDIFRRGRALGDVHEVGMLADEDRLVFRAGYSGGLFAGRPSAEIGIYSVKRGRAVAAFSNVVTSFAAARRTNFFSNGQARSNEEVPAAIRERVLPYAIEESDGADGLPCTPVWATRDGFVGRALGDAPLRADGVLMSALERPAMTRAVAAGEDTQTLLDEDERDYWLEYLERVDFSLDLYARDRVEPDVSLRRFVDAAAGISHLLPAVLTLAAEGDRGRPRFGHQPAARRRLTVDSLVRAARTIHERSAEERQVLFDEMLERLRQEAIGPPAGREIDDEEDDVSAGGADHADGDPGEIGSGLVQRGSDDELVVASRPSGWMLWATSLGSLVLYWVGLFVGLPMYILLVFMAIAVIAAVWGMIRELRS